jgi:hypothetical protein
MNPSDSASLAEAQADFQAAMPRIARHGKVYFRHVRCRQKKADLVQEVVGLAWKWWLRLVQRGKNPMAFVSTLASFAARAVRCGRRVCGQLRAKDVMSEVAQQRRHFTVSKLPDCSTLSENPLAEALIDHQQADVPDHVAFRIDFPCWRRSHSLRNRRIIDDMMVGNRTSDLARKHRISPARVSQLRRELHRDWQLFTGDGPKAA